MGKTDLSRARLHGLRQWDQIVSTDKFNVSMRTCIWVILAMTLRNLISFHIFEWKFNVSMQAHISMCDV